MLDTDYLTTFVKDRKRCQKKHWGITLLNEAIIAVAHSDTHPMDPKFNDHALTGDKKGNRLLHVNGRNSNWIMMYKKDLVKAVFIRTGTHDEVL
jgi:mRNA interferase YafQ